MTNQHPRPTSDIDYELEHTIKRFQRLRWWSVLALGIVVLIALVAGGVVLYHQNHQLTASCSLYHDLSKLSVTPPPPSKQPSRVTVTIVVDARRAYIGECPGDPPPPDPSLVFWAHYYGLTVPV